MSKTNLLNLTVEDLATLFLELNEKKFRASQIIKWIHQLGETDFSKMSNLSLALRKYLLENCTVQPPQIIQEQIASDKTIKWLLRLEDKNYIETVFIPENNRGTLCISSQVGCPLGCLFCATGALVFKRNLTLAEIIGQLWLAVRKLSSDKTTRTHVITNVVFMGMGEPLLNYVNVIKATQLMLDDNAYGLSKYKVTVSTCGIIPEVLRLSKESEVALAISLHAPNDELRSKLMPINKKYSLRELIAASDDHFKDTRRQVTIEYVLISGVNDQLLHAKQLIRLLSHGRYKVNLLHLSHITHADFKPSQQDTVDAFRQVLLNAGINTITRKSKGEDIAAACGQLAIHKQALYC